MESKTNNKVSRGLFDINSMTGKMFFATVVAVFFLTLFKTTTQSESIQAVLSLAVIVLPILTVESILTTNQFLESLIYFTGLVIIMGAIFFKLWPLEEDYNGIIFLPLFPLAVVFLGAFFRLLKESDILKMDPAKINGADNPIIYCLKNKAFRELLTVELWILLSGAFSHMLVVIYAHEEMSGLPVLLLYLVCFIVFFIANLFGMLSITKKVKKSPLSVVSFAIITPIAIPLCIIYSLILLSISEKLAG